MQGQKAVVVLIIAMVITGGIGFFANFEKQGVDKTEYNPIGNMDAFVSANSERAKESEVYNSIYNVTGWTPNGGVQTIPTGSTNQYVLTGEVINTVTNSGTYDVTGKGTLVRDSYNAQGLGLTGFKTNWSNVVWNPRSGDHLSLTQNMTSNVVGPVVGGYGQQNYVIAQPAGTDVYYWDRTFIKVNNTVAVSYDNGKQMNFTPLSTIISAPTELPNTYYRLSFNESVDFLVNYTMTYSLDSYWQGSDAAYGDHYINLTGTISTNVDYMQYNFSTQRWVAYDGSNNYLWSYPSSQILVYSESTGSFDYSITTYSVSLPTYADPTKYVVISTDMVWSNFDKNESLINSEVSILIKGTGQIRIGNGEESTDYLTDILTISMDGGKYYVNNVLIGSYVGLRITLSSTSNAITVQGILNELTDPDTPVLNYTLGSVTYTIPFGSDIPLMYRLQFIPIGSMQAFIDSTSVLTDPNQIMWSNIDLNLSDYFGEYLSEGNEKLRILLQGFVRYGESININGEDYDLSNNGITITTTEIITPAQGEPGDEDYVPPVVKTRDIFFTLNGLAIDYYLGHVYLRQYNGTNSVDLGEIDTYILSMKGVWYFSSTTSEIHTYRGTEDVWKPGWDIDMNTTLLLFAGCVIFLSVIMMMRFRDMMDWEDIVILICSIVLPLVLVAV